MTGRLPAELIVSALLRRTNDSGGMGVVLARGDPQAGGILIVIVSREGPSKLLERGLGPDGATALIESRVGDDLADYWRKRRRNDPDVWIVELDSPSAERFAAETMLAN